MNETFPSGVYILRNVKSNTVIDVKDGAWNHGKVQGWRISEPNQDPDDLVNQRFLISPNPKYPEAVNILNLRAGAYIGCVSESSDPDLRSLNCCWMDSPEDDEPDEYSSVVYAQATDSQSSYCLWIPEKIEGDFSAEKDSIYRFRPFDDEKLSLSIAGGSSENGAAVVASTEVLEDGRHQYWKLERTDMDTSKAASWMSQISPQSTKFNMLSIPGTHQSLALNRAGGTFLFTDNPRCQDHSPYLQLCDGIRYMDLRVDLYPSNPNDLRHEAEEKPYLIARHGNRAFFYVWEGYSLSAVLQSLSYFLEKHPGETVFVSLRLESGNNADADQWVRAAFEELRPWGLLFFYIDDDRVFADLSLEDVRGKVILFSNSIRGTIRPIDEVGHFPSPINNIGRFFRSNDRQTIIGNDGPHGTITVSKWEEWGMLLSANIAAAGRDDDPRHVYRTGLNCSGRPGISGLPFGSLYNPSDFFDWLQKNWIPSELQDEKHPIGTRMGLITLDFYDSVNDFVRFIISRNQGVALDREKE